MMQNESILTGIVDLIRSKKLADLKPEDEQCLECIRQASKMVSDSGSNIHQCKFCGPHIGSRYGEVRPRLVLVGLENPDQTSGPDFEANMRQASADLEKLEKRQGSRHRQGEFALIQKIFPLAEVPFAHVATVNQHLHGLHQGRGSASKPLPPCPYVAQILRMLRPKVIIREERQGKWLPNGKGWGEWTFPIPPFKAKIGTKYPSAVVMTADLDGAKVALVLANHPARPFPWISENNYRDKILVPAVEKAIQLVRG